ncbi:MAG: TylF/MycF/NovP-related O-methyltransferase [Chthoniobacter sp.]|uniref:TylF/MycF/NovP-related O-methyltransferase n=1 Tax=Chthoniobacter sp. TaxID=2510640 RepID=UPI0032AB6BDE
MSLHSAINSFMASQAGMRLSILVQRMANRFGYEIRAAEGGDLPDYYSEIYEQVRPYTMTSRERLYSMIAATEHLEASGVKGAIVECGVWRGGSIMAALYALARAGKTEREIFLYDTYAGMSAPGQNDGAEEHALFDRFKNEQGLSNWCLATLEDVKANVGLCHYPLSKITFVQGKVEDTIPAQVPAAISLLRLDTDWYESTLHELIHLYPRLVEGGLLIIDDYGKWGGCRRAVDEYFEKHGPRPFLHRVDPAGRLIIKPPASQNGSLSPS